MTNLNHIDKIFLTHLRKIEQNLSNIQELIENKKNKMPAFDRDAFDRDAFDRDAFVRDTFVRDTFVRDTFDRDTFDRDTFDKPKYERTIKKKRKKKKSKIGTPFSNYIVDTSSSSEENSV